MVGVISSSSASCLLLFLSLSNKQQVIPAAMTTGISAISANNALTPPLVNISTGAATTTSCELELSQGRTPGNPSQSIGYSHVLPSPPHTEQESKS